jgi:hypothetical protein
MRPSRAWRRASRNAVHLRQNPVQLRRAANPNPLDAQRLSLFLYGYKSLE